METQAPRRASARATLSELSERVTRVETTAAYVQDSLLRIDTNLAKMQAKLDSLALSMAQGVGGLRVGVLLGQAGAAVLGFLAAHLWPGLK